MKLFLDYPEIYKKSLNYSEMCIIASKEYSYLVEEAYTNIVDNNSTIEVYILSSDDIICPLKHKHFEFSVILGVECPVHKFKDCVHLKEVLTSKDIEKINAYKNVIYDSMFSKDTSTEHINLEEKITISEGTLVVSRNPHFYKFFNRLQKCNSFFDLLSESNMEYLTRRINIAEIAKNNKTFAIIFIHEIYKPLAMKIQEALFKNEKYSYLLHLKNVSYTRLITIEKIDTIVLIDCPVNDNLEIDVTLPILTPSDVKYILSREWNSTYRNNVFDYTIYKNEDKDIMKYEGAGKLLLESEFFGIEYECQDKEDLEIYEGKKGMADKYEHE